MSIIRVENLGKKYLIGHDRKKGNAYRYESLRDTIAHTARGIYQRLRHPLSPNPENTDIEDFWALRDVSFEIEPGDRIGIIGRNGAGKSTLLKILSRITVPTEGRVEIEGRVASLLEVGTGFHPELTGRENIYLNGAVLGMTRAETQANFDEIVAFAEIEKFLDTPVKRFSSGMYVRLAFAVAAHLSPEILVVDEVLAVGDAAFQKKCLGKMEDVAGAGRTVLFVSHNMESIKRLCSKAILLDHGKLVTIGETVSTIASYLSTSLNTTCKTTFDPRPDCVASITSVELLNPARSGVPVIDHGTCGRFRIEYTLNENVSGMHVAVNLETVNGHHLISTADTDTEPELFARRSAGRYSAEIELPTRHFNLGRYALRVSIGMPGSQVFDNRGGFFFEVIDETGDRSINQAGSNRAGLLLYKIPWISSRIAD